MPKLDATAVARLLVELGRRTALAGNNYYRSRAYLRAAESLAAMLEPLERVVGEKRLREIPGIGDAIADIVTKLHHTGTHQLLERLRAEVPEGVLDMLSIPGLHPEKVNVIYKELGITSLAELETAARQDRLSKGKGLGAALQRKVIQGLAIRDSAQGARHVHRAAELIAAATQALKRSEADLVRVVPAGDLRRGGELVYDLAVVAEAKRNGSLSVVRQGELSVHLTDARHFGAALLLATGSQQHLQELGELAKRNGLRLTAEGLWRGKKVVAAKTEPQIYKALGLQYIEPELREGRGEIQLARAGRLPALVKPEDVQGILHAHTVASDGVNTLEEMAEAARSRGYGYLGVTDHSRSAHYAGGLSIAEIEEQHAEIDRLNASFATTFWIFKGIESDILPDGSLDYPDEVLRRFDFIIGSVHSQFRMDKAAQTERILRAAANPFVTVLGHLTGRQLLRRPGYELDVERVMAACAENGVAIEINGNPWRLDLDWRWYQRGLELGCMFSVNPDAHSVPEIDSSTRWGIAIARKGGVGPHQVVNTLDAAAFGEWLEQRRTKNKAARNRSAGVRPSERRAASVVSSGK
jgi:DNA polymerase (family 10)